MTPPRSFAADDDPDRWQEADELRREFRRWIVIWLSPENEFRAYCRLPGARRDTVLRAPTAQDMATQIKQAEQLAAQRIPRQAGKAADS